MTGQITSSVRALTARRLAGTSQTRRATSGGRGSRCTSSCFCRRWTSSSTRSQRALAPAAPIPAATSRGSWRAERHLPASIGHANGLRVGLGLASPSSPSSRSLPPAPHRAARVALVPVTNEPMRWLEFMQKTNRDDLAGLRGGQLRDYLAGNYKTGSGSNKRPASHYRRWQKVVLPEGEARQHLALCPLSEQLARRAASPSPPPQASPAAPTVDPAPTPAAGGEVRRHLRQP